MISQQTYQYLEEFNFNIDAAMNAHGYTDCKEVPDQMNRIMGELHDISEAISNAHDKVMGVAK
jgi:hypothetical protein